MEIVEFDPRRDEPDEESESLPCAAWNRSGSTHPIVTLRTSGRELHHYHRLARALGPDQPLYSLGHCVGTSSEPVPDSQDKWATHFVGLLGELDLGDNLILGGWSNSGIVSLDVAHRLAQLGRPPAVVVLFDSRRPRPDTEGRRVWAKWTGENLVNWACSPTKEERRALVRYKTTRPLKSCVIASESAYGSGVIPMRPHRHNGFAGIIAPTIPSSSPTAGSTVAGLRGCSMCRRSSCGQG